MNFQKTVNTDNFKIITDMLPKGVSELTLFIERVITEDSCPGNITSYLIHSNIEAITEKLGLNKDSVTMQQYKETISRLLEFMHDSGMGLWFYTLQDNMSEAFEEYADVYLDVSKIPEDKDCSGELIAAAYYYITGVAGSDYPDRIGAYKQFTEALSGIRESSGYNDLMNEYDDLQSGVASDEIMKSLTPVELDNLPEYIIDSLYLYKGRYYKPSDVRKMITASSQTAQSLERQDLEPGQTPVNMSAEDHGRAYIKKLKSRKEKKKEVKEDGS